MPAIGLCQLLRETLSISEMLEAGLLVRLERTDSCDDLFRGLFGFNPGFLAFGGVGGRYSVVFTEVDFVGEGAGGRVWYGTLYAIDEPSWSSNTVSSNRGTKSMPTLSRKVIGSTILRVMRIAAIFSVL